ncbi:MAG: NINE protein [Cryobacterium sp.]|nr:NINE protein [Cryobacterium sp.]
MQNKPPTLASSEPEPEGQKDLLVTLIFSYFFGYFGIDRFYLGKTGTGLLKLFTLGGGGYWWFVDFVLTLTGRQLDSTGRRLRGYEQMKKPVWRVAGVILGAILGVGVLSITALALLGLLNSPTYQLVFLGVISLGAIALGLTWIFRGRIASQANRTESSAKTPKRIRQILGDLFVLREIYAQRSATEKVTAPTIVTLIDSISSNTTELFSRLSAPSLKKERTGAEFEYEDKLAKLSKALSKGYLLDILDSPKYWDHADQRIADVQLAARSIDKQLLENIQQINSSSGLVFQLALDNLYGEGREKVNWQREFDSASENHPDQK